MPKNRVECRSGMRDRCQFDSISNAISRWRDPSDRLCFVLDRLAEVALSCANAKNDSNLEDSNLYQCKRKLGDGHFPAAIKVFFGCDTFFAGNPQSSRA